MQAQWTKYLTIPVQQHDFNASIPLNKLMTDRNTWTTASKVTLETIFSWDHDLLHLTEVILMQVFRQFIAKLRFNQQDLQRFTDIFEDLQF